MSFQQNHEPKSFDDLVFHDPAVAKLLREYADGKRNEHLILHGSFGAGKSSAARIICKEIAGKVNGAQVCNPINGRTDKKRKDWKDLPANFRLQLISGMPPFVQIDEVDHFNPNVRSKLYAVLESRDPGTLIMTANQIVKLEDWFSARCVVVHVEVPQGNDYLVRSQAILKAEGYSVSDAAMKAALSHFQGSLRDLTRFLENQLLLAASASALTHNTVKSTAK